jgi:hypothetical protein
MGQTLCLGYAPLSTSGEMFSSLYRLFQAVRAESTVALSGESSDEIFGGYPWFHDPMAIDAATFPWLSTTGNTLDGTQVPEPDLLERLNLPEFQADSYAQAIAETPVHQGEDAVECRMREIPVTNHTVPYGTALWVGAVPGTSCLATIMPSLWDKIHSARQGFDQVSAYAGEPWAMLSWPFGSYPPLFLPL